MQHKMKALKCKTLGGIHTHMRSLTLNCKTGCVYCACVYECLAAPCRPSPVSRLFHAGCTSSIPPEEVKEKEEEDGVYEAIPGDK